MLDSVKRKPAARGARRALALALASLLVCAAAALAATPLKGAVFTGTSSGGNKIKFSITSDGSAISSYKFVAHTTCSNGEAGSVFYRKTGAEPSIPISSKGRFALTRHERSTIHDSKSKRNIAGTFTDAISGRFTGRRKASGTIRIRFQATKGKLHCDTGSTPFTAHA